MSYFKSIVRKLIFWRRILLKSEMFFFLEAIISLGMSHLKWTFCTGWNAEQTFFSNTQQCWERTWLFLPHFTGHIGIAVPDVNKACKRFEELGVKFVKKPDDGKT